MKPCNNPSCPHYESGIFVPPTGMSNLLILGEQPAFEESQQLRPFVGNSGKLLDTVLSLAKVPRRDFAILNSVNCFVPQPYSKYKKPRNKKEEKKTALVCKDYVCSVVSQMNPKHVLALGGKAQYLIDGRSVEAMRGFVRQGTLGTAKFQLLSTYHPASCFRSPENFDLLVNDVRKFMSATKGKTTEPFTVEQITTVDRFKEVVDDLLKKPSFAFDIETNSFELGEPIFCISFALRNTAYVVPFREEFKSLIMQLLNSSVSKYGQNVAFDNTHLRFNNVPVVGPFFDCMIAHHLLCTYLPHDLNTLATIYTDLPEWESVIRDIVGYGKKAKFSKIPYPTLAHYCGIDGIATFRAGVALRKEIANHNSQDIFDRVTKTMNTTVDLRLRGVFIDLPRVPSIQKRLDFDIAESQQIIFKHCGKEFNINSSKQLGVILFDVLKLSVLKFTATGARSTAKDTLEALAEEDPIARDILAWRKLSKLRSTFVSDELQNMLDKNSRLHTEYKPTGTTTGRLSSKNVNLQNIPRKAYIRQMFSVPPGYKFVEIDHSMAELRVVAFLSNEKSLLDAFEKGEDIHTNTASEIFQVAKELVTHEMRVVAKFINFGVVYGRGAESIARMHGISLEEAELFLRRFFAAKPYLTKWLRDVVALAQSQRFLQNIYGRIRRWPVYGPFLSEWEREARNFLPQSIVAEKTLESMNTLNTFLMQNSFKTSLIMNGHDSLSFETHESELDALLPVFKTVMEMPLPIIEKGIPVEIKVASRWWDSKYQLYENGKFIEKEREDD